MPFPLLLERSLFVILLLLDSPIKTPQLLFDTTLLFTLFCKDESVRVMPLPEFLKIILFVMLLLLDESSQMPSELFCTVNPLIFTQLTLLKWMQ